MYNVVFISKVASKSILVRCVFRDEEHFNSWYNENVQSFMEVVEKGVSDERMTELCPVITQEPISE